MRRSKRSEIGVILFVSTLYNIGDVIDVHIEKTVPRGLGLAFAEKLTVFVPLSAAGDELRVRIVEIKKRIAFAEIVEIKQPSPLRIVPPCPYFGKCGGCDFQQMRYAAQLEAKVGIIRDCLHRIGKIEYEREFPIIASPRELNYRSRGRWHIDRDQKTIGYFARDSHDVIDIKSCPILTPELETAFENVRGSIEWGTLWAERSEIEASTDEEGQVSIASEEFLEPPIELSFGINGDTYAYSSETFFQANKFLIGELINAAIGGASGEMAFDLYCGVGLFTLPLARHFGAVVAVEGNPAAS